MWTMNGAVLDAFQPATRAWFSSAFAAPTLAQARRLGGDRRRAQHALVVAPTGSGKTLAAFLWALDRLAAHAAHRRAPACACSTSRR